LGVEDYPELPKIKKSDVMLYENVLQDIFLNTIAEVEYAVDKNGMRPAMCGIYVEPGKQPKIVSTNGIILSLRSLASESIGEGEGFIIPEEALQMLKKILPEKFTITRSEGKAFFSDGTMEFSTRLIGEKYPKYQAVIPKENEFEALVNRQELISVIKRLKLFKDKVETGMVIKFSAGRMIMEISNTLIGHTGKEWIESKHNLPDDFVIGVWPDYVLNSILAFNSEEVKLTFSTPSKAILITDPVNNENISLVMPRKVDELV
jgi:DNA polymerase-3 subunit beta